MCCQSRTIRNPPDSEQIQFRFSKGSSLPVKLGTIDFPSDFKAVGVCDFCKTQKGRQNIRKVDKILADTTLPDQKRSSDNKRDANFKILSSLSHFRLRW
jgi:hypothetical protein